MPTKSLSNREYELMLLLVAERTGRDVAKLYARQYGRSISFGTLYTTLRRLSDIGLVTVTRESDDADGRFRYYRLTGTGARSLERTSDELRAKADLTSARLRVNP